jgi:hypothetical protein
VYVPHLVQPKINAPPPGAYRNFFFNRTVRRLRPSAVTGNVVDAVLWFDFTDPAFATQANGGEVRHGQGWDIRLEGIDRTPIPYEREVYDPATGRVAGWLRLPGTLVAGRGFDFFLYFGRDGIAADQQDPSAVWEGCAGSWRMPDGKDMAGSTGCPRGSSGPPPTARRPSPRGSRGRRRGRG